MVDDLTFIYYFSLTENIISHSFWFLLLLHIFSDAIILRRRLHCNMQIQGVCQIQISILNGVVKIFKIIAFRLRRRKINFSDVLLSEVLLLGSITKYRKKLYWEKLIVNREFNQLKKILQMLLWKITRFYKKYRTTGLSCKFTSFSRVQAMSMGMLGFETNLWGFKPRPRRSPWKRAIRSK